jgi:hypothetical protein
MAVLNNLFGKYQLKEEVVDLPELGECAQVKVVEMGADKSHAYFSSLKDADDNTPYAGLLIAACMVDDRGNHCHKMEDAKDIQRLMPVLVINKLVAACNRVNGIDTDSEVKKKDA